MRCCSQLLASEDNSGPASGLQGESSRHARILPISVRIAFNRALYKTTNKIAKNHRTFIRPDTNLMISSKKTFTFSPYRSEPFLPLRRNVPELCPPCLELSRLWNCESFLAADGTATLPSTPTFLHCSPSKWCGNNPSGATMCIRLSVC